MPRSVRARTKPPRVRSNRTTGEKLLRNTAIACTLLMCVMAMSKLDTPWSKQVTQTIASAVTMRVDLDDTLGKLNFVRDWMPDTALVFWNMGAGDALARPVSGALTHAYTDAQPWLEYQVRGEQPVYAAADGTVAALSENDKGEWTMLIDHEGGEQTVYAYMGKAIAATGQALERGAQIGVTQNQEAARLYFEMRAGGVPVDPSARMSGA
ncbi:MAG: M23 family metallopeptidase [Clostridia bacterium]